MAERLPLGAYESDSPRPPRLPNGVQPHAVSDPDANGEHRLGDEPNAEAPHAASANDPSEARRGAPGAQAVGEPSPDQRVADSNGVVGEQVATQQSSNGNAAAGSRREGPEDGEPENSQDGSASKARNPASATAAHQIEAEWIEQYEPGVYITLVALRDGSRDLKRVRFR